MKIEKNKIVFASLLMCILLFLIGYSLMVLDENEAQNEELDTLGVPELKGNPKEYDSKLDAVDDIKEQRDRKLPSLYQEKGFDSLGYFDKNYEQTHRDKLLDSINLFDGFNSEEKDLDYFHDSPSASTIHSPETFNAIAYDKLNLSKQITEEHNLFFAGTPSSKNLSAESQRSPDIYVEVSSNQVVKKDYRLSMRLSKSAVVSGTILPANTPVYGFISFKPNRVLLVVQNIAGLPVSLKGYDLMDGAEGIYLPNRFRSQVSTEVADDLIEEINLPGVPQVKGITKVLKRDNRTIKARIPNNYKLILKPRQ